MVRSTHLHLAPCAAAFLAAAVAAAALSGCGASGSSASLADGTTTASAPSGTSANGSSSCAGSCGSAVISLTDAPGDFDSYIVNVVSLQLTRADGTVVQTVPQTTPVDFAQLVDLSEILSAAQIPAGQYVSAALTLDYSGALLAVDNGSGPVPITASDIIDGATQLPLAAPNPTQITLSLSLPTNGGFVVTANAIATLALDFNLLASNVVGPSPSNPVTVTVNPLLTASVVPDPSKPLHVRGPLVSVDAAARSFVLGVRPFFNGTGTSGQLTVSTTPSTSFAINGTAYSGSAGLGALANLATGTLTAAYGSLDASTGIFTATSVLAGSSLASTAQDSLEGTITARSGATLTVADNLVFHGGSLGFGPTATVTIGSATAVTELAQSGSFTIQDLSVGQHVILHGTFTGGFSGSSSSGPITGPVAPFSAMLTMDATQGGALMMPTVVAGTLVASGVSSVTLDVLSLDGRPPGAFDFAGTGSSAGSDANPSAYVVSAPSALSMSGLASGQPLGLRGFVAPFGAAPPDFSALTLLNYAQISAVLQVLWAGAGPTAPFASASATQLVINQATLQSSARDAIRIGPETLDPATLAAGLVLQADAADDNPRLVIAHLKSHKIDSYASFADYTTALTAEFSGTVTAQQIIAQGPYEATSGTLSVDAMIVGADD